MSEKKTKETDTQAESASASKKTKASQQKPSDVIIDVTPEAVSSGKGLVYSCLVVSTIALGLGGFATYKLIETNQLSLSSLPSYPDKMNKEYGAMLDAYQEMADAEISLLNERTDTLTEQLEALSKLGGSATEASNGDAQKVILALESKINGLEEKIVTLQSDSATAETPVSELTLDQAAQLLKKLQYQRAADALASARNQSASAMRKLLEEMQSLDIENAVLMNQIEMLRIEANALFTRGAVKESFAKAADEALAIRIEGEGWWQQQVNKVAKLVKVRKVNADADSIADTINKAESALEQGKPDSAISLIQSLNQPASGYFTGWLPKAAAYDSAATLYKTLLEMLRNPVPLQKEAAVEVEPMAAPEVKIETPTVSIQYDEVEAPSQPAPKVDPVTIEAAGE